MLLRYIVSNFKSIGHPIELSMLPVESDSDEQGLKAITTKAGEWKAFHRSGFFGPNASGKSSLVESIHYAKDFILNGQKVGRGTGISQFKGEFSDLDGVSLFQFMFYSDIDNEVYEYGFTVDRRQVHEEWLMQLEKKGFVEVFSRAPAENGKTRIDINSKLARRKSADRNLAEVLKENIQEKESQKNQLFLSRLYENGVKKAEKIVAWFRKIQIIFPETKIQALPIRMRVDEELRSYIGNMLGRMDTGVFDIRVASDEIDFYEFAEKAQLPKSLIEDIEEVKSGILSLSGKYFVFTEKKEKTVLVQLKFEHFLNNKPVQFNIEEESDGTQRLLDLLPMLFKIDKDSSIYIVDEIDRSLHTKLSQFLLDEFSNGAREGYNQIIFTAHDVNLINLRSFKQGEIWFIEKNGFGESVLRPFTDFKIEPGQDELKAYLNGRFGAIPMIRS